MVNCIWKIFSIGELFDFDSSNQLSLNKKGLDISPIKDEEYNIALITQTEQNNGISGFLKQNDEIDSKKMRNYLTYSMHFGLCFYHDYDFVLMDTHGSVFRLIPKKENLNDLLLRHNKIYSFISSLITKVCSNNIYNYGWLPNSSRVTRELLLLPLLETTREESIWEFDGKYYTLAVEYIENLVNKAKENIEERTINSYKQQKDEQINNSLIYKDSYCSQVDTVIWKPFKVGDLFVESTEHYLEKSKKNYNISETKDEEYCVAVCAASKVNNGIVGYINEVDDVPIKKRKGYLTKGGFGHVFYQDDWFIKPGGSWGMLNILKFRDDKIKRVFDSNTTLYKFMAKILTKLFTQICSWGYSSPIDREIILLPLLETTREESIWEFDGKYYTLAVDVISYLYYVGRVNMYDNKIKNYKCVY